MSLNLKNNLVVQWFFLHFHASAHPVDGPVGSMFWVVRPSVRTCVRGRKHPPTGLPSTSSYFYVVRVAEWLAYWTQAQKGLSSSRSRDAVG